MEDLMKCLLILNTVAIVILLMRQRCRVQEHFVLQDKKGNDLKDVEILTTDPNGNLDRVSFAQIYAAIDQAKKEATEDGKKYTNDAITTMRTTVAFNQQNFPKIYNYVVGMNVDGKIADLRKYTDDTFATAKDAVRSSDEIIIKAARDGGRCLFATSDFDKTLPKFGTKECHDIRGNQEREMRIYKGWDTKVR